MADMNRGASERDKEPKRDMDWIGEALWMVVQIPLLFVQEIVSAWRGEKKDPPNRDT